MGNQLNISNWPPDIVRKLRWRLQEILGKVYFKVVLNKPWVDYRYTRGGSDDWQSGSSEGAYSVSQENCETAECTLRLSWRVNPGAHRELTFIQSADLANPKSLIKGLWKSEIDNRGSFDELHRHIDEETDRMESLAERFSEEIDRVLPVIPSIFEMNSGEGASSSPPDYRQVLLWGEGLLHSDRYLEAKELLPMVASISSDTADPAELEFGRQACILLTQFPFAFVNGRWNPKWYLPLFVKAFHWASRSILQNPRDVAAFMDRAMIQANLQNYQAAEDDYSTSLRLDETLRNAYLGRASARHSLGRLESALQDYGKALTLDGRDGTVYSSRAWVHYDLAEDDPQGRIRHLQAAVSDMSIASRLIQQGTTPSKLTLKNLANLQEQLRLCEAG